MSRRVTLIGRGLIVVGFFDLVSLVLVITIAVNQSKTLDQLHMRSCANSGALISAVKQQTQQATPKLYKTFLPNLTNAQIQGLISQQRQNASVEITTLRQDCSKDDLNIVPSN